MFYRVKHSRTALLQACSQINCKEVDPLPPIKRMKMNDKKMDWARELCKVYGQSLPDSVNTEGALDEHLRVFRCETSPEMEQPANELQLQLYLSKYDFDQLTDADIANFKGKTMKEASYILQSRMTLPTRPAELYFRRMIAETQTSPTEAEVLHSYAVRSIANMQEITDGLKATYESQRGRFHYLR